MSMQQEENYASFDIFDTLLTRVVGQPADVFLLLGQRLLEAGHITCSAEVFAQQRRLAEDRALSIEGCHPRLFHIYCECLRGMNRNCDAAETFVAAELEIEDELLREVPGAAALVEAQRAMGRRILFVSDTNMPSSFLTQALSARGFYRTGDRIFASCEARADKARGLLFPHVANVLGADAARFIHFGNSAMADVRNARLSGWRIEHLPHANLNRYERALAAESFATGGIASLLSGCARIARLANQGNSERERSLAEVTAGVMAPTLVAWMLWLLRRAASDGCKHLYFVSRDGQILLQVARLLERRLQTGIEMSYLYVGRQPLMMAGTVDGVIRDMLRAPSTRLQDFAEVLNWSDAELASVLPPQLQGEIRSPATLTPEQREHLKEALTTPAARELAMRSSSEARSILLDYLRQEGWTEGPFGLVDVGWRGSTAGALADVLPGSSLQEPFKFYYFGLGNDAHAVAGAKAIARLDAWFYDDSSRHGQLPYMTGTSALIEMFCSGDHGSVAGYRRSPEGIQPRLRAERSPMFEWGLPLLWKVTLDFTALFAEALPRGMPLARLDIDLRHGIAKVLALFWLRPSKREVRHWGSFPVQANFTNTVVLPLAERLSFMRVLRTVKRGSVSFVPNHAWPRGTALSSPWLIRNLLLVYWRVRKEEVRLRRRMRWMQARLGRYSNAPLVEEKPRRGDAT